MGLRSEEDAGMLEVNVEPAPKQPGFVSRETISDVSREFTVKAGGQGPVRLATRTFTFGSAWTQKV